MSTRPRAALLRTFAAAALVAVGLTPTLGTPAHAATAQCIPTPLWTYDSGYGARTLHQYTVRPDLSVSSTPSRNLRVNSGEGYGDIALSRGVMYGIAFDTTDPAKWLQRVDLSSGNTLPVRTNQGGLAMGGHYNSLTALPDGTLLAGAYSAPSGRAAPIMRINPSTGRVTQWGTYPGGGYSAGDFYALPDRQVIGFGATSRGLALMRWGAGGGAGKIIGTIPNASGFGAAVSAGWVYVVTTSGLARLNVSQDQLAHLPASYRALPLANAVSVSPGGDQWGMTGIGDAHSCDQTPVLKVTKTGAVNTSGHTNAQVGDTIKYTYRVTNTGDLPIADVDVSDPKVGSVSCPQTSLGVGASMTCHATYVITAADIKVGSLANVAGVSGAAPRVTGQAVQTVAATFDDKTRLTVAYPKVVDHVAKAEVGESATINALQGAARVQPGALSFPTSGQPARAAVTDAGRRLTLGTQGTWTIDPRTGAAVFQPAKGFKGQPTAVKYVGTDLAGNVTAPSTLKLVYAAKGALTAAEKAASSPAAAAKAAKAAENAQAAKLEAIKLAAAEKRRAESRSRVVAFGGGLASVAGALFLYGLYRRREKA